jgi:hypothetical protein
MEQLFQNDLLEGIEFGCATLSNYLKGEQVEFLQILKIKLQQIVLMRKKDVNQALSAAIQAMSHVFSHCKMLHLLQILLDLFQYILSSQSITSSYIDSILRGLIFPNHQLKCLINCLTRSPDANWVELPLLFDPSKIAENLRAILFGNNHVVFTAACSLSQYEPNSPFEGLFCYFFCIPFSCQTDCYLLM